MANSGLHVVCAFPGSKSPQRDPANFLGRPIWSERVAYNGTTSKAVPGPTQNGDPVFYLVADGIGYAIIGPNPNAPDTPELRLSPNDGPVTVYARAGDKVKWVLE